jgi:hypothetical protein
LSRLFYLFYPTAFALSDFLWLRPFLVAVLVHTPTESLLVKDLAWRGFSDCQQDFCQFKAILFPK